MLPAWLHPQGSSTRFEVGVTFLETRASRPAPVLPEGVSLERVLPPALPLYRKLYREVGEAYCWWMRRPMPDEKLAEIVHDPDVYFMVLWQSDGTPLGFYELDLREGGDANLAYFGLLPAAIGRGLGRALLDSAISQAFSAGCWRLRVNTCTLDHPRALTNYQKCGFVIQYVVQEIWNVPDEYVPAELRRL
ncbi:GNAT family N-acetyltransferase [Gluconobacter cerinus]